jgi:hypothetical protein
LTGLGLNSRGMILQEVEAQMHAQQRMEIHARGPSEFQRTPSGLSQPLVNPQMSAPTNGISLLNLDFPFQPINISYQEKNYVYETVMRY